MPEGHSRLPCRPGCRVSALLAGLHIPPPASLLASGIRPVSTPARAGLRLRSSNTSGARGQILPAPPPDPPISIRAYPKLQYTAKRGLCSGCYGGDGGQNRPSHRRIIPPHDLRHVPRIKSQHPGIARASTSPPARAPPLPMSGCCFCVTAPARRARNTCARPSPPRCKGLFEIMDGPGSLILILQGARYPSARATPGLSWLLLPRACRNASHGFRALSRDAFASNSARATRASKSAHRSPSPDPASSLLEPRFIHATHQLRFRLA